MATDWDPDDMAKVAFHEAGHAVVMWLLSVPIKRIRLDLNTQGGSVDPNVDAEVAARQSLLEVMAARYAGPIAESMFGGPPNQNTERRAEDDDEWAGWQLNKNGVAPSGADGQSLKTRGRSWAEELLRRHESRVRQIAKRLLQPPYKITREQFEQMMQEEDCEHRHAHIPGP